MAQQTTLFHLAASIEELLDAKIVESRAHSREIRQLRDDLAEIKELVQEAERKIIAKFPSSSNPETATIKVSSLMTWGSFIIRWMLPIAAVTYESYKLMNH